MTPKVSVIVPCYGVEKYLERCLQTLVNQTLQDMEIILVDDKSPDKVPVICDVWKQKDSRIRVVHKLQNEGLGFARNTGLEIASGEYVAFVDSDDYLDLSMYGKLYDEAKLLDSDAVFCGFKIEERNGLWIKSEEVTERTVWTGSDIQSFMLDMVACAPSVQTERKYYMSVWHGIYKNEIIKKNNLKFLSERQVVSEDIPFQVDFLKLAERMVYIPDNMYHYCNNGTSLTATFKPEKYWGFHNLYKELSDKLSDIPDAQIRVARLYLGYTRTQLLHLCASSFPTKISQIKDIVNDSIWKEISNVYKPSSVANLYQKLMYQLILRKQIRVLYFLCFILNMIKKL